MESVEDISVEKCKSVNIFFAEHQMKSEHKKNLLYLPLKIKLISLKDLGTVFIQVISRFIILK